MTTAKAQTSTCATRAKHADLLKLDAEIDDLLLPWKVDLSLKHMIDNPSLLAHIERVGIVIYSAE